MTEPIEDSVARLEDLILTAPDDNKFRAVNVGDLRALIASWRGRGEQLKAIREALAAADTHLRDLSNRREPDPENWARHD